MNEIVAVDVETTGLSPQQGDRICEIALMSIVSGQVMREFVTLVNPERSIPPEASAVNRITDAMVRSAPTFRDIADQVHPFLEGKLAVLHNGPFDLSFLEHHFDLLGKPVPNLKYFDTLKIARKYFDFPSNRLPVIAKHLQVDTVDSHRAAGDAWRCYQVFAKMVESLDVNQLRPTKFPRATRKRSQPATPLPAAPAIMIQVTPAAPSRPACPKCQAALTDEEIFGGICRKCHSIFTITRGN